MRMIAIIATALLLAGCAQIADGGRYIISTAADRTLIEAKCDDARAARAMALGRIGAQRYPSRADTIQAAAADLAAAYTVGQSTLIFAYQALLIDEVIAGIIAERAIQVPGLRAMSITDKLRLLVREAIALGIELTPAIRATAEANSRCQAV